MNILIDYFEKSKQPKRNQREKAAFAALEPWKSLKSWFPSVASGLRKRTTYKFFTSKVVFVDDVEIDLTINRLNRLGEDYGSDTLETLLHAVFAVGKEKPRGKGRIIRAIAPRVLQYPLYS